MAGMSPGLARAFVGGQRQNVVEAAVGPEQAAQVFHAVEAFVGRVAEHVASLEAILSRSFIDKSDSPARQCSG